MGLVIEASEDRHDFEGEEGKKKLRRRAGCRKK